MLADHFGQLAWPKAGRKWSTKEAVDAYFNAKLRDDIEKRSHNEPYMSLEPFLVNTPDLFKGHMDSFDPAAAIQEIFSLLREVRFRQVTRLRQD